MRWKKFVAGLALGLTAVTGCKQPVFMTEDVYQNTLSSMKVPAGLETDPREASLMPDLTDKMTGKPADVLDPERPIKYITLSEAIAQALQNGTVGQPGSGLSNDASSAFPIQQNARGLGYGAIDRDSIRVLALDPANVGSDIEAALSKFDAWWITSMSWNTTDRPVSSSIDVFQAQGTTNAIRTQAAELTSSLIKPLPTGGVAAITFDNTYSIGNLPTAFGTGAPIYTPSITMQFEQPLLQGYGVDVNEIRSDHPGSILTGTQFATQPRNASEGILLSRIRFDQTRADFEANVQAMLLNVEIAYWNLYAAYGQLYAQEIALRKNLEIWRLTKERVDAGVKNFTPADEYESQGQYESSRSSWLAALGGVLEAERNLRGLLGMKPGDKTRLVPADKPSLAPFRPDWSSGLQEALVMKPELVIAREQLKATQFHIIDMKNRILPDVRFTSTYNVNAIGTSLSGPSDANALQNLAGDHFNSWSAGIRGTYQFGMRDANAGLRLARLQLAQAYWSLRTDEDKVTRYLALQYRHILEYQQQIEMNLAAVQSYNNELNVRIQRIKAGTDTPDVTLQAIRFGSAALVQYYQFVGQYNAALANYEFAKGTLLERDKITVADGPLPACAAVEAVNHEKERETALILKERAVPPPCPAAQGPAGDGGIFNPDMQSLPDWLKSREPLPPDVNNPPAPLPASLAPTTGTSPTGFGAMRPLSAPLDRPVPGTTPALPGNDLGSGSH